MKREIRLKKAAEVFVKIKGYNGSLTQARKQ